MTFAPADMPGPVLPAVAGPRSAAGSNVALRLWVAMVALCAFGPYVLGGLRTEQLAVYGSALFVLLFGWPWWQSGPGRPTPRPFFVLWGSILGVALIGTVWPPFNETNFLTGSSFAGLDNWALPIATVIATAFWCERLGTRTVARIVSTVTVLAMVANAVIALTARVFGSYGATPWVEMFWQGSGVDVLSVAANSLGNERYTGLFNQPVEAGICYSIALIGLAYLARLSTRPRAVVLTLLGLLIAVGGLLSVSKVFLFGGLPLFVVLMVIHRGRRLRMIGVLVALALVAVFVGNADLLFSIVTGTTQLTSLVAGFALDASTLSAGRFGNGGTLGAVADQILVHHAALGMGAGGVVAPYDSAWIEAVVTTGVVGVALLVGVFVLLGVRWWRLRGSLPAPESEFALAMILVLALASLGMPSLTGNKVATVVWLLVACLLLHPRVRQQAGPPGSRPF